MGFLFIALGNVFNVYAPALVRDGVDHFSSAVQAASLLKEEKMKGFRAPGDPP